MATKDRTALKDEFKNGNLATGEKFADLIDSMKVVQLPVVDPQALGTSLSFIDSITQDEDGKITATKKTLDLPNAHELNPFKGWYKTGDTLPTDGFDGAYLYFKDTSELTGQTTIYRWNGTTYADTGTVVDTSNVQTFETGQSVNGTGIKDLDGNNDPNAAGVLSAEAGKGLNEDLYGTPTEVVGEDLAGELNQTSADNTRWQLNPSAASGEDVIFANSVSGLRSTWINDDVFAEIKEHYTKIRVRANSSRNACIMFAKKVIPNTDFTFQELLDGGYLCDGVTESSFFSEVTKNQVGEIEIPTDAIRCYVCKYTYNDNSHNRIPEDILPVTTRRVGGTLNELKEKIDGTVEKVREVAGYNLCNPEEIVDGAIYGTDGNLYDSTSYRATGYIPIDEEGVSCELSKVSGQVIGYAYYDENRTKIAGYCNRTIGYNSAPSGCTSTFAAYVPGAKYVRFTILDKTSNVMVNKGTRIRTFEEYQGEKEVISSVMLPQPPDNRLEMLLPDKFYQVAGDPLQLFYRGLIRTTDLSGKFVCPRCDIGVNYVRMFESSSNSVGTKRLTIDVFDENRELLSQGGTDVHVVSQPVSPDSVKHVLLLGGSFIANSTIYNELTRRLTGTGGSPVAAGLDNISIHRVGNSGWGWYDYTHDNRSNPSNPFWIGGKLDVAAWVAAQNWGDGETLDVLYAIFAYNGLYANEYDPSVDAFRGYIESFIAALPPSCTLVLAAPVLPNVQLSKMTGDGASTPMSDTYQTFCKVWEIYKLYKQIASEHTNVEFEAFAAQFDMEYGYPLTTPHAVNIRKTDVTIPVVSNTIHPSDSVGYLQLADAAYRSVVAHLCQPSE